MITALIVTASIYAAISVICFCLGCWADREQCGRYRTESVIEGLYAAIAWPILIASAILVAARDSRNAGDDWHDRRPMLFALLFCTLAFTASASGCKVRTATPRRTNPNCGPDGCCPDGKCPLPAPSKTPIINYPKPQPPFTPDDTHYPGPIKNKTTPVYQHGGLATPTFQRGQDGCRECNVS